MGKARSNSQSLQNERRYRRKTKKMERKIQLNANYLIVFLKIELFRIVSVINLVA